MNMWEMVLALFAVVLFTSLAAVYNRQILEQNDYLIGATQHVQATQLCHSVLDEIDSKLFARKLGFNSIVSTYNGVTRNIDLNFPGDLYTLNIQAAVCDSMGTIYADQTTDDIFRIVTVTANTAGLRAPVTIQRLYTKIHYYNI